MLRHTRRKFLITAGVFAAGTLALGEDTVVREPNHPQLVEIDLSLPRLPAAFDGFRIAQLSDFHYDDVFSVVPIRAAVEMVNQIHPDLVVLTGDFVTGAYGKPPHVPNRKAAQVAEPCAKLLSRMRSRLGSMAVLGNHDVLTDPEFVRDALQSHGIPVLQNRSRPLEKDGARLWFCGLDSLDGEPDLESAMRGIPSQETAILLVHEPDFADTASRFPIDLQLSGHSHGGQIWLPGIGAPWLPPHARKYPRGQYRVGSLPLYTNIGLGTIRIPVRMDCPPEVTLVTLRTDVGSQN